MRLSLEFKKSILMIFLLLLCVLQMGILWVDKSPGVSIFSSQRFWPKTENIKVEEVKKNYIHPGRIIVSDGTEVYWPLEPDNAFYSAIWNGFTGSYLKQILEQSAADNVYYTDWDTLIKKKCVIVEFKCSVPVGILQWLTGTEKPAMTPFKEISKVAIIPDSLNHNEIILYLTEDGVNVYEYIVNIEQGSIRKEDYYYPVGYDQDNETIIPLRTFGSCIPVLKMENFLPFCPEDKELKMIRDLRVTTPMKLCSAKIILTGYRSIYRIQFNLYSAIKTVQVCFFLMTKKSFIITITASSITGTEHGPAQREVAEEALEQALTFIEYRRKNLELDSGIYLTDIVSTNPNYYVFTFNYFMYGMEIKVLDEKGKTIKPSIRLLRTGTRSGCKWYIKTFSDNDFAKNYDLNFINFYENKLVSNIHSSI